MEQLIEEIHQEKHKNINIIKTIKKQATINTQKQLVSTEAHQKKNSWKNSNQ